MTYRWNPLTGNLDLVEQDVESASKLLITRIADGAVTAGRMVRPTVAGKAGHGSANSTLADANVYGMATTSAADGETFDIVLIGIVSHPDFSSFAVNAILFLNINGTITDVVPTTPTYNYQVYVGKALGNNEILVMAQVPMEI